MQARDRKLSVVHQSSLKAKSQTHHIGSFFGSNAGAKVPLVKGPGRPAKPVVDGLAAAAAAADTDVIDLASSQRSEHAHVEATLAPAPAPAAPLTGGAAGHVAAGNEAAKKYRWKDTGAAFEPRVRAKGKGVAPGTAAEPMQLD